MFDFVLRNGHRHATYPSQDTHGRRQHSVNASLGAQPVRYDAIPSRSHANYPVTLPYGHSGIDETLKRDSYSAQPSWQAMSSYPAVGSAYDDIAEYDREQANLWVDRPTGLIQKPMSPVNRSNSQHASIPHRTSTSSPAKANPYHNRRKAGRTGQDESFYVLEYHGEKAEPRPLPDLDVTLSIEAQDGIISELEQILSTCMFNFFAAYAFPIPTDSSKKLVRKPSDRAWHEWLELAVALCEKRMIPKVFLHNERIKEFATTLRNSGEIRHVYSNQDRTPKSDMGIMQLISAAVHVAQIIKDADGMDKILAIKNSTEIYIRHNQQRERTHKNRQKPLGLIES